MLRSLFVSDNLRQKFLLFFLVDLLVILSVFGITGVYNRGVDADIYISQIESYNGHVDTATPDTLQALRLFKPLYGVVGALLAHVVTPEVAILIINISFLIGLTFLTYLFLRQLRFDPLFSTWGVLWVAIAYPVLKYGLALSTDMAGWFFCLAVVVTFLFAISKNQIRYIVLASLIGFLGSLTKETGVLGLIFCGIYLLMQLGKSQTKLVFKQLTALCVPFFSLQAIFLYVIHISGAPTFLEWYKYNQQSYGDAYYKLHYFLGVEIATFNILLIFACLGLIFAYKHKDILKREWVSIYLPLGIAVLPTLLWPIFVTRVLFAQFIFFVPLSLYSLNRLNEKYPKLKIISIPFIYFCFVAPILISLGLFLLSDSGSIFDLVKSTLTS